MGQTRQQQIDKIAQAMCEFCTEDKRCVLKYNAPCGEVASQDCSYKENAEMLLSRSYGDVTEYKAEREMLDSQIKALEQQLNDKCVVVHNLNRDYYNAIERLRAQGREIKWLRTEKTQLENNMKAVFEIEKKQAQIDMLNKVKSLAIYDDNYLDGYVFIDDIDELIEEIE